MPKHAFIPDQLHFRWQQFVERWRETRWKTHAKKGSFKFEVQPGVHLRLYFNCELSRLIYFRHFEAAELEFLNRVLRPGDAFVDIGANIGLFTIVAAHLVGARGCVWSLEPITGTFTRLQENIRTNCFKNVHPFRIAMSDANGQREMFQSLDGYDAWNSMARPAGGVSFAKTIVETVTWDHFAETNNLVGRVTMMKIDVEGWETRVLLGARRSLSRPDAPILQIEFNDAAAADAGSSCQDLYELLERFGYSIFQFQSGAKQLAPDPLRAKYASTNLFAVKDLQTVNARLQAKA